MGLVETYLVRGGDELSDVAALRFIASVVGAPVLDESRHLLARLAPSATGHVAELARRHGVEAWLAACAPQGAGLEPLRAQRPRFLAAQARTVAVLGELGEILAALGCPWAVLKGPALAYTVYPRPDLRHSVDLDLLVPPGRFGDVLAGLAAGGFTLLDRNWPVIAELTPGELRVQASREVLIDLHWTVVNDAALRRRVRIPTTPLLDRARRLEPLGFPALCEVDQLVHLGIHGALSGANRLAWLLDAHLAAGRIRDWDAVVSAAHLMDAGRMLAVVLVRAARLWPTPVPSSALRRLAGGSGWRLVERLVGGSRPVGRDPARPGFARAWARSVRTTGRGTLAEFARHGAAWLRSGGLRDPHGHPFGAADDPASPLHPLEDEMARGRYLATVAEAD
jgi:hypothetical protein